jgi:hypothetical protein
VQLVLANRVSGLARVGLAVGQYLTLHGPPQPFSPT